VGGAAASPCLPAACKRYYLLSSLGVLAADDAHLSPSPLNATWNAVQACLYLALPSVRIFSGMQAGGWACWTCCFRHARDIAAALVWLSRFGRTGVLERVAVAA
jgi:hypothetical protein